jgi:tetratricopeptide (TPR) repeat protein
MSETELKPAEKAKSEGNTAFVAKKYDEAIAKYTEAMDLDKDNDTFCAVLYSNRSACWAAKKDWEKAYEDAAEGVKKDIKFIKGYYRLSAAQAELGKFDEALDMLSVALKIDPTSEVILKQVQNVKAKKSASIRAERARNRPKKQLDEAEQKAFMELQNATTQLNRDLRMAQYRKQASDQEIKKMATTMIHIEKIKEEKKMYRSVGKCFMMLGKEAILDKMEASIKSLEKEKVSLTDREAFLTRRINSNTKDLQQMIGAV